VGAFAYCLTLASFVAATRLTTAANAIVLQYTAPVYVLVFGWWFLGERTRWFDWAGVGGAMLGMGLFFFDQLSTEGLAGNALAVFSGLAFAVLVMLLRHQKDGEPLDSVFVGNVLTALLGLPGMLASRPDLRTLGIIVVLGTVQIALPYVLYTRAIKQVSALEGLLIPVIEPILNPLWVMLVIGEVPGRWAIIGATIVVSAITARGVAAHRAAPAPDLPAEARQI
jgi:drug/metabolite transporter (DMT)-like permease